MKEAKRYNKIFKSTIIELYKKGKSTAELSREYSMLDKINEKIRIFIA